MSENEIKRYLNQMLTHLSHWIVEEPRSLAPPAGLTDVTITKWFTGKQWPLRGFSTPFCFRSYLYELPDNLHSQQFVYPYRMWQFTGMDYNLKHGQRLFIAGTPLGYRGDTKNLQIWIQSEFFPQYFFSIIHFLRKCY